MQNLISRNSSEKDTFPGGNRAPLRRRSRPASQIKQPNFRLIQNPAIEIANNTNDEDYPNDWSDDEENSGSITKKNVSSESPPQRKPKFQYGGKGKTRIPLSKPKKLSGEHKEEYLNEIKNKPLDPSPFSSPQLNKAGQNKMSTDRLPSAVDISNRIINRKSSNGVPANLPSIHPSSRNSNEHEERSSAFTNKPIETPLPSVTPNRCHTFTNFHTDILCYSARAKKDICCVHTFLEIDSSKS